MRTNSYLRVQLFEVSSHSVVFGPNRVAILVATLWEEAVGTYALRPDEDFQVPWAATSGLSEPASVAAWAPPLRREWAVTCSACGQPMWRRAVRITRTIWVAVMEEPDGPTNAGPSGVSGVEPTYMSHAVAGHTTLPGILGRASTVGADPGFRVFDECTSTRSPFSLLMMSLLANVWGPLHNRADGASRLDLRRKAKKPMVIAAFTALPFSALSRYVQIIIKSFGDMAGAGEGV